ncbi:MAG TPA: response regulator [Microvirga sp.]|jgi:DNA-binding NtrC family response regulator|nr:response regulator [Microvirga sp.]
MSSGSPLVLLVEEETQQLDVITAYLEEQGFAVLGAGDADSALEQMETRTDVRAVVTDAHVPGHTDGVDLAGLVRERWPEVAVVMMSGHSDAKSGPVPEGAHFINKPNLLEHLGPTLRRALGPHGR